MSQLIENMHFEQACSLVRQMASTMDDFPFVYDIIKDSFYISERATMRFSLPGYRFKNLVAQARCFVYKDDIFELTRRIHAVNAAKSPELNIKCRLLTKQGRIVWVSIRGKVYESEDHEHRLLLGCVNEIGVRPQADNVSGLLDVSEARKKITDLYGKQAKRYALRIGVDDFHVINEKYGLEYGDFLLRQVAESIKRTVDGAQNLYHGGSDEFVIMESGDVSVDHAIDLYHRIRVAVDEQIKGNLYEAVYTISGGAVFCEDVGSMNLSKLEKFSQFALTEAKKRGRNQVYVFDEKDYEAFLRRNDILRSLRESVAKDYRGFKLVYQPIMDKNGKLRAAEGLLRYTLESGETISPGEFVPILEESGLIIPVGAWIVKQGVSMSSSCQPFMPGFKVSINLSYIQLLKSPISDVIIDTVKESGLSPDCLIVELTESGYLENLPLVQRAWKRLREFGIDLAIDDFGTGYSNFQYISNMRPNIMKLDRSFTLRALEDPDNMDLMKQLVHMAHTINLITCVEGIETAEELEKIKYVDSDLIQGFYYGIPMDARDFIDRFIL